MCALYTKYYYYSVGTLVIYLAPFLKYGDLLVENHQFFSFDALGQGAPRLNFWITFY